VNLGETGKVDRQGRGAKKADVTRDKAVNKKARSEVIQAKKMLREIGGKRDPEIGWENARDP